MSDPGRLRARRPVLRVLSLVVIGVLALTNAVSTGLLVHVILAGSQPEARTAATRDTPILDPEWLPTFVDYLCVSATNAIAFSQPPPCR